MYPYPYPFLLMDRNRCSAPNRNHIKTNLRPPDHIPRAAGEYHHPRSGYEVTVFNRLRPHILAATEAFEIFILVTKKTRTRFVDSNLTGYSQYHFFREPVVYYFVV